MANVLKAKKNVQFKVVLSSDFFKDGFSWCLTRLPKDIALFSQENTADRAGSVTQIFTFIALEAVEKNLEFALLRKTDPADRKETITIPVEIAELDDSGISGDRFLDYSEALAVYKRPGNDLPISTCVCAEPQDNDGYCGLAYMPQPRSVMDGSCNLEYMNVQRSALDGACNQVYRNDVRSNMAGACDSLYMQLPRSSMDGACAAEYMNLPRSGMDGACVPMYYVDARSNMAGECATLYMPQPRSAMDGACTQIYRNDVRSNMAGACAMDYMVMQRSEMDGACDTLYMPMPRSAMDGACSPMYYKQARSYLDGGRVGFYDSVVPSRIKRNG